MSICDVSAIVKVEPKQEEEINATLEEEVFVSNEISISAVIKEERNENALFSTTVDYVEDTEVTCIENNNEHPSSCKSLFDEHSYSKLQEQCSSERIVSEQFNCDKCSYASDMKRHLQQYHLTNTKTFTVFLCNQCRYATNSKLKPHILRHKLLKSFKCEKCGYMTYTKVHFKNHLLTHKTSQDFKCEKCDYVTNIKLTFIRHLLTHNTSKDFKCDQCQYTTNNKYYIKHHLLNHKIAEILSAKNVVI